MIASWRVLEFTDEPPRDCMVREDTCFSKVPISFDSSSVSLLMPNPPKKYLIFEDLAMLLAADSPHRSIAWAAVSYTHLTLPTTPYV